MHWWCRQYLVTDASQEAKVTEATCVQAYQYFWDICSWRLLNRDAPLMLGGPGVIVQIDESLFRHKPKVELLYMIPIIFCCNQIYFIFQNHCGRPPRSQIWVFGMVDVSHTPALGYMQIVPQRDARTLLPIIQQHIRPGTIVRSSSLSTSTRMQRMLEWVARNRRAVYW